MDAISSSLSRWAEQMLAARRVSAFGIYYKHHNNKNVRCILRFFFHIHMSTAHKPEPNLDSKFHHNLFAENCIGNVNSYASLLQTFANNKSLSQGKQLHAHLVITGLYHNIFLCTKISTMYAICGSMVDARQMFDKMPERSGFLWNTIIRGYACNGSCEEAFALYYQMQDAGTQPDKFTFPFVLKACASLSALEKGKEIHCQITRTGFESDVFVGNALVAMYAKCGSIDVARKVFDRLLERHIVSWNAMTAGYAQNGNASEALALYKAMQLGKVKPNPVTVVSALRACAQLADLQAGKGVHDYIVSNKMESDVFVETALIDMYAKCGSLEVARQLFDRMSIKDIVSWNAMIAGYAQSGHANDAMAVFHQMKLANVKPDRATIVSVLPACSELAALEEGRDIHDYVIKNNLQLDVSIQNCLVTMYSKCGCLEIGWRVFDEMSTRDLVSWNAMIAGFAQSGYAIEALNLFCQMQLTDVVPNEVTTVSVLQACAYLAALQQARRIHGYIIRSEFDSNVFVATALIDMYAKCGRINIACQLFERMSTRDVVTWNAMIAGYGMHGYGEVALAFFKRMQLAGMKPDHITCSSVLCACCHAGLVDDGWQLFDSMNQEYGITPRLDHYASMVDLLGLAGQLHEAHDFIKKMPLEPNARIWGSLLAACRIYGSIDLGQDVAERLFNLEPENAGNYVLLSNIYAAAGRWDDVVKVRTMMKDKGLKKTPGCSFIEVNDRVHTFLVGDRSHPQSKEIYATLEILAGKIDEAGYLPNMNFVLHDVEEEVKEDILQSHSEKLAIAFGLLNTSPGTPIQITKNLRVCGDCHSVTKFISKIVSREIIVRDANRFHHFKDGSCSCRDYW